METFTFKNAGYLFAGAELSQSEYALAIATHAPKYHTLDNKDPIKADLRAGVVQRKAESMAGKIDAFMVYNKDSQSYIAVDEAKFKAHKGDKFHRTVAMIVSSIANTSEFTALNKDEAKKKAVEAVRTPLKLGANTIFNRLEKKVKEITDPKPEGAETQAEAFKSWSDGLLKQLKARRKTSEARNDLVPSEKWLNDEIIIPMQTKLKDWYAKNSK